LARAGFTVIRIKGSHYFLQHEDGRGTVVPVHSGEMIGPGSSDHRAAMSRP
jgi:predicted RNA binding protein YcfA (HicA-like mRNA interferase family)